MRLKYLHAPDCQRRYEDERNRVTAFQVRGQSSWHTQACSLVRLAKIAYGIGRPLDESRSYLRQATAAYRETFALRGTTFATHIKYKDGQPVGEERQYSDGYTSVDSFVAALAALCMQDLALARELVTLAGHSPNAALVTPRSDICNSNEQTLSHALNALVIDDVELAKQEASKLEVRRGTRMEKQLASTISAIAANGDFLNELQALLFYHEKLALRRDNLHDPGYWFCLPALGLSYLAIHYGSLDPAALPTDSVYCPRDLLLLPAAFES